MARLITKYPLEFSARQRTILSSDSANELQMLFLFSPNSRVDFPSYGVAGEILLQLPNSNEFLTTALINMRAAVMDFAPEVGVQSITATKDSQERSLTITLTYNNQNQVQQTFKKKVFFEREAQ